MTDFHTPGAQPPGATPPKKKMSGCMLAIVIVVGITVVLTVLSLFLAPKNAGNAPDGATPGTADNAAAPATASETSWTYQTTKDAVRNTTDSYASIVSDNKVEFDFPYNGGSTLQMTVRHDHRGDNVYFVISKGQFVCGIDTCSGEMNIDGTPRHLTLTGASDGSSDTLFASGESGIIKALKSAKKIIVELPFYQSGNQQFTFTTAKGLDWPPKAAADQPGQ
ncbi:MAG TPA: hypothetical protein VF409_01785 [Sphingomonas sp.]